MARLIYSAITSLDGYIEDEQGRRMYETMVYWETADTVAGQSPVMLDYAQIWQAADKVVYSTSLDERRFAGGVVHLHHRVRT